MFVKEEVPSLILAGGEWLHDGNRWYIMSWVVKEVGKKLLKQIFFL
jgi:hypothetical protein